MERRNGALGELTHDAQQVVSEMTSVLFRLKAYKLLRKILLGFIFVSVANVLFSYLFYTPKMYRIVRANRELVDRCLVLQERISAAQREVEAIRHRDERVYRSLFAVAPASGSVTELSPERGAEAEPGPYAELAAGIGRRLDELMLAIYNESRSFDELQALAHDKERMSASIPAIWPIDRAALHNNHIGAFNPRRMHPILHRIAPHNGVDFGCDRGTPVYATGDAVVEIAAPRGENGGFGHQILLDHAFGYKTRYAHLSKVLVSRGDRVVRGQKIGETGNTGRSTAPHLHYEVIHKGVPVNPINYFNRDMTAEEYDRLLEELHDTNFEM